MIFIRIIFTESKETRPSEYNEQEHPSHEVDESILFFTLFGSLLLNLSSLIAAINVSENFYLDIMFWSTLAGAFTSLCQVLLICKLFGKKVKPREELIRNLVTTIAFINLSIWIQDTFLFPFSGFRIFENEITIYGIFGWVVIWRVAQPLCAFFRFHSFVIFLEVILTED